MHDAAEDMCETLWSLWEIDVPPEHMSVALTAARPHLLAAKDAEIAALALLLREVTAHAFPVACDCDDCLMSDGLRVRISAALEMSGGAK